MAKSINLKNMLWHAIEYFSRIAFGLLSVILVARYFGPESLGKLSQVQATSELLIFLVVLGLDNIILHELAKKPQRDTIFSCFILQSIGWCMYLPLLLLAVYIMREQFLASDVLVIIFAVSLNTYFTRATIFRLYFQAVNLPKFIAWAAITSRFFALFYMLLALFLGLEYQWVIYFLPLQALLQTLLLAITFLRQGQGEGQFKLCINKIKSMLKPAMPILLASALFPLFTQADILIISTLLDDKSVGLYSAAAKLVAQFIFVGNILTLSFFNILVRKQQQNEHDYQNFLSGLSQLISACSLVLALVVFLLADPIVNTLYGEQFSQSSEILKILVWKWVFIIPAALYSRLLVVNQLTKYELSKSLIAAAISIAANIICIPIFGVKGAALVSLLSFACADLLLYGVFKETRSIFWLAVVGLKDLILKPISSYKKVVYVLSSK
ncbi:oligosaccharide flippase family protein [Agarivorans gilvus]|uniref:LPS biosynthesis protein n=1 Tax=Agarivorans gilvus TaxID=680279 RepID=A0ABQ1I4I9_9ALTE|nr:oligosaccharide flippase family protein [Agarivorans gilvus]GGB12353.1 LPS biosynthesis protein [Agarivorans gilvus]